MPDDRTAAAVLGGSVLSRYYLRLLSGTSDSSLHVAVDSVRCTLRRMGARARANLCGPGVSWRVDVEVYGSKSPLASAAAGIREHLAGVLPFEGPVKLSGPVDVVVTILLDGGPSEGGGGGGGGAPAHPAAPPPQPPPRAPPGACAPRPDPPGTAACLSV